MRRHGFTLKELLVVIAVIGIVAAILFPVIASAREKGRATSCLSNEGQISKAALIYAGTNDDRFPDDDWLLNFGLTLRRSNRIDKPFLQCPNYRPANSPRNNGIETGGYAINGCLRYRPVPDAPARIVMFGEIAQYEFRTQRDGLIRQSGADWLMMPDDRQAVHITSQYGHRLIGPHGDWGAQRHSGRGNYVFVDGHASSVAASMFKIPNGHPCGLFSPARLGVEIEGRLRFASLPWGNYGLARG